MAVGHDETSGADDDTRTATGHPLGGLAGILAVLLVGVVGWGEKMVESLIGIIGVNENGRKHGHNGWRGLFEQRGIGVRRGRRRDRRRGGRAGQLQLELGGGGRDEEGGEEKEMSALLGMAKLKALTNQPDSAFILMKSYISLKDSAYDVRLQQQILDVQNKYENEKLEQDLQLIKTEKEYAEITLKQRKTQLLLLIFILISMTGAGIFLFYRHQQRQKAAIDAEKILQQEARLSAVFQVQEEERRRIAKELHDGLGQTLGAIKLNYQSLSRTAILPEYLTDFNNLEKMLDNANTEVRSISHQMMPKELEQFGLIAAVEGMLKINLEKTPLKYCFEHSGFNDRVDNHIELVLFRVLQELVSNVIKHSKADMLNVQIIKHMSHVVLNVSDNGIGFDVDKYEKKGIGLLNIASRIDGIKGHLHFESVVGEGTTITIRASL